MTSSFHQENGFSLPASLFLNQLRNFEFTWDLGLTEPAPRNLDAIFVPLSFQHIDMEVFVAFIFVVAFFRNGPGGTAGCAGFATLIEIVKTVCVKMRIDLLGRLKGQIGNHTTDTHGFTSCGDQSVAQPESAQATGISGVAL
jgi:hypothetical protein